MAEITHWGLTMTRVLPGLYQGDNVRAERVKGLWRFDVKGRELGGCRCWIEHCPEGHWCAIGPYFTLKGGLLVAEQLRRGTHFFDEELQRTRLFSEEVYAEIRAAAGQVSHG